MNGQPILEKGLVCHRCGSNDTVSLYINESTYTMWCSCGKVSCVNNDEVTTVFDFAINERKEK